MRRPWKTLSDRPKVSQSESPATAAFCTVPRDSICPRTADCGDRSAATRRRPPRASLGRRRRRHLLLGRQQYREGRGRPAQDEQEGRDDRVGNCDRGSDREPYRLAVHEPKEGQHRPGEREAGRFHIFALDDKHPDRSEHQAGQDRAAAEHLESVIEHAHLAQLLHADSRGARAGGAERAVHQGLAPGREVRRQRQHDRRRVSGWRGLERLRADQHADVEQDRRDRDHRHQRQQHRDDAEPRQDDHHHARGGREADATAHRLPAGMADIDRVDERVAHQATDQADDAVGGQHARGGIVIARRFRALDIVHRLDQVVDAEGNGCHQDDAKEFEA